METTFITAALIGILYVVLGIHVGRVRGATKTSIGTGGSAELEKAVRAHANLAEWAPITLIVLGGAEVMGANSLFVLVTGAAFVFGRICHGYGLAFEKDKPNIYREIGAVATVFALLLSSLYVLYLGLMA